MALCLLMRLLWISLTLLVSIAAGPAGAVSQTYVLAPGSTITPVGGTAQALSGELTLAFVGLCVVPVGPATCALRYDIEALSLAGGGESILLQDPLPPLPGPFIIPSFSDLGINPPDPAVMPEFVFERDTESGPVSGVLLIHDRALRTPPGGGGTPSEFAESVFPTQLLLDLELVEIERRSVDFDQFPTTLSRTVVATLSISAKPVPEPTGALLFACGLVCIARVGRARSG